MKCPECNKEMTKLDNTTFLSNSILHQLFSFKHTHYGCFDCGVIKKV